ncbi:MAG TPA: HlyD family efflux transporter periplasmic adaptor subunit [Roseiflexaceae bacterium]|nr:HlyD family efflux transporter periplasmic adaptor subunit [Roseiflexaceae bacterium]
MNVRALPTALFVAVLMALTACSAAPQAQSGEPTPTPRPVQAQLEKPTYTVQRGTVVDEIKVSGFVAAVKQQELSFTQSGFLKVLYVDRTDVVTEGQLLAELDLGDLPNQLRQAEVALEQAQLQLDRNKAQRAFDQRRAQLDLEDAQARLRELQAPPDPRELAAAQRAVADAQTALEETRVNTSAAKTQAEIALREASNRIPPLQVAYLRALEEWNDLKDKPNDWRHDQVKEAYLRAEAELRSAENAVTQAQVAYDTARQNEATAVRKAESALAEAQAHLEDLTDGPDPDELAAARRAVERAQVAVEEASQQGGDSELEGRVAAARLEVERIQSQIDAGRLYAAFAGRVSEIGARPGDSVEAYKAVVTVIDDSELELLVEGVNSQDANRIGLGQQVVISFSRAPGQTYQGVVTKLPTAATSSAATINPDRAYHIDFNAPGLELEVGDLAQVIVTLKKVENALWLPPQAVRAFEGRRFVVVKDGDRQRRQDVRVGIVSLERVEILEGLKEGDVVVGQ